MNQSEVFLPVSSEFFQHQLQMMQRQQNLGLQQASSCKEGQDQQLQNEKLAQYKLLGQKQYLAQEIEHPGPNDVMCGRGGGTNNHIGNVRFRQLVNGHKLRYLAATKVEKPMVAREVVTIWRNLNPPGRFLSQLKNNKSDCNDNMKSNKNDGNELIKWRDVGDKKAREKASQCLRERTPDVIPFVKKLELQQRLQDKEKKLEESHDDDNSGEKGSNSSGIRNSDGTGHDEDSKEATGLTAAQVSQELLQLQKEAAAKAHMSLHAFISPTSLNSFSVSGPVVPSSSLMDSVNHNNTATNTSNTDQVRALEVAMQRQQIALLQQQQAQLQAQAARAAAVAANNATTGNTNFDMSDHTLTQNNIQNQKNLSNDGSSQSYTPVVGTYRKKISSNRRQKVADSVPLAAELLDEIDGEFMGNFGTPDPTPIPGGNGGDSTVLTMEEYQKSIEEFLGEGKSNISNGMNNNYIGRSSDLMDAMSRNNSWIKSFTSLDDTSLSMASSAFMMSPENSMKYIVEDAMEESVDDVDVANIEHPGALAAYAHRQSAERNRSSFSTVQANNISSQHLRKDGSGDGDLQMPPPNVRSNNDIDNIDNQRISMQIPLSGPATTRPPFYATRSNLTSTKSQLSDLTAGSALALGNNGNQNKQGSKRSMTMSQADKTRSEVSMMSELTDLSEALGSLDMSTTMSYTPSSSKNK